MITFWILFLFFVVGFFLHRPDLCTMIGTERFVKDMNNCPNLQSGYGNLLCLKRGIERLCFIGTSSSNDLTQAPFPKKLGKLCTFSTAISDLFRI